MKDYLKYAFSFLVFGVLLNSAIAQVDEIKPTFKFKKENADTSLFSKGLQNTWLLEKPFKSNINKITISDFSNLPIVGINKIGNIYALPLDNMPCLVPFDYYTKNNNMSVIKMDNGFYTPVQIPNPLFNGNNATSILFLQPK